MTEEQAGDLPLPGSDPLPELDPLDFDQSLALASGPAPAHPRPRPDLAPLFDVKVTVEAVLGGTSMTVDELLGLTAGSVVEVDRRVGEPIDLMVGGRVLARGELVLIDGALGLTLTEIVRREDK